MYESHAVVQVTMGDGSVTYECSFCDYHSTNPRSVAAHYRTHVIRGEVTKGEPREVVAKDVPIDPDSIGTRDGGTAHEYTPSERLVRALAHFLEQAGTLDVTALAFAALRWAHERPDLDDLEREPREPLTDGQILARIRLLVGGRDPETEEALRNALSTVDFLTTANARLEGEKGELQRQWTEEHITAAAWEQTAIDEKARADRLQEDINAWLSLAPRSSDTE
jgi:hypothetical protein